MRRSNDKERQRQRQKSERSERRTDGQTQRAKTADGRETREPTASIVVKQHAVREKVDRHWQRVSTGRTGRARKKV